MKLISPSSRDRLSRLRFRGSSSLSRQISRYRDEENMDLHIHSPIRPHDVVLNLLSTVTTLLLRKGVGVRELTISPLQFSYGKLPLGEDSTFLLVL
jgi:hypothetical protein